MTHLLFIHGRAQETEEPLPASELKEYVSKKKETWLAGLNKGLDAADYPHVSDATFPFYGNALRDAITEHVRDGGEPPDLGLAADGAVELGDGETTLDVRAAVLTDLLAGMGYTVTEALAAVDPALLGGAAGGPAGAAAEAAAAPTADERGFQDLLRIPKIRAIIRFLAEKTPATETIIARFLKDVGYYIANEEIRAMVLGIVKDSLAAVAQDEPLVVVGHSLGSIVAFDLIATARQELGREIALFVTAGSPLGLPIVQTHLPGHRIGSLPPVPDALPPEGGWVNCYDVRDFVSTIHPLGPAFRRANGDASAILDYETQNDDAPHSIALYLRDPRVAAPIGRALR